jgi:hypothetical protein
MDLADTTRYSGHAPLHQGFVGLAHEGSSIAAHRRR